jgi:hypothetical protein
MSDCPATGLDDVDALTAQIEAELNEYLGPNAGTPSVKPEAVPQSVPLTATKLSIFDESDFLSWLEDTPEKNISVEKPVVLFDIPKSDISLQKAATPAINSELSLSSYPTPQPTTQNKSSELSSLAARSMDSLFDEIFGKDRDSRANSPISAIPSINIEPPPGKVNELNAISSFNQSASHLQIRKDYEEKLRDVLNAAVESAGIGEVSVLRQLISDGGYIPTEHRIAVWSLILTGGRYLPDSAAGEVIYLLWSLIRATCFSMSISCLDKL